jgi:hypothetical protein
LEGRISNPFHIISVIISKDKHVDVSPSQQNLLGDL